MATGSTLQCTVKLLEPMAMKVFGEQVQLESCVWRHT